MARRGVRVLLVAVAALLVCSASWAQDYAIKFERPEKAGDRSTVTVSVDETRNMEISSEGNIVQKAAFVTKAQLEADRMVVAVDGKGEPTSVTYTARKWEGSLNGKPVTEVRTGMVIEVRRQDGGVFIGTEKGEFAPEIKEILGEVLPDAEAMDSKLKTGVDEIFGTAERKKVGDKWPINAPAAAKTLAETGVTADEKDITGTVELRAARDVAGVPCLHLAGEFKVARFKSFDLGDMKIAVRKGDFTATLSNDLPVDTSASEPGAATMTAKIAVEAQVAGPQGQVGFKLSAETRKALTSTPAK